MVRKSKLDPCGMSCSSAASTRPFPGVSTQYLTPSFHTGSDVVTAIEGYFAARL